MKRVARNVVHGRFAALMLGVALVVAACGGGGGGGSPVPPPAGPGGPGGPVIGQPPPPPPAPPSPPSGGKATLRVGPCLSACDGTLVASLEEAAERLKPGDILDIYPTANGQPYPAVKFTEAGTFDDPIIVRGVTVGGVRPTIQGGEALATSYSAVAFEHSHHMLLENLTITNGIQRRDAAGVISKTLYEPQYHQCVRNMAAHVTLRDVLVTGCPNNGVFAADLDSGSLTLERVEINGAGCDHKTTDMECPDVAHPVYVATDAKNHPGSRLRIVDSVIRDNNAGVAIKSRAERLEVHTSWVRVSHSNQVQAVGIFGYDSADGDAQVQADLGHPIHADLVGNVFLVDSGTSLANAVIRSGSDFAPDEDNANTFGRVRLVNNTFVLAGNLTSGARSRSIVRFFGKSEGLMSFNNLVVVAGNPNGKVVFMSEDLSEDDGLPAVWVAPDGLPRVMLSHNSQLPDGSFVWAERTGENYAMDRTPPNGFAWSDWVTSSRKLSLQDGDLRKVDRQTLRDLLTPSLRRGTTATNPAVHPAGGNRVFAIPDALPLPTREPAAPGAAPGQISLGASRDDAATPTLGALQ